MILPAKVLTINCHAVFNLTGTEHAIQYPCPKGYYNPDTNQRSLNDCLACDPGKYCGEDGNITYTDDCDEG